MDDEHDKELPKVTKRSGQLDGKGMMEEEKSKLERLSYFLKRSLFSTLYVLVKDSDSSLLLTTLFTVIRFIQLHMFVFRAEFKNSWNENNVISALVKIINFTYLYPYFVGSTWDNILIIFYFLNGIVILIVFNIVFVGYLSKKGHLVVNWPVQTLRFLVWLSNTIFFMPILQVYFNIFSCQSVEGQMHQIDFQNVICWKGMHVLHSLVSMIFILLFTIICLVTSLTYFDSRPSKFDPHAKTDGRLEFSLLSYQMFLYIVFAFMNSEDFRYILFAVILGGAILMYQRGNIASPFQNERIRLLWVCLTACYLWSTLMLGISIILEKNLIQGTLIMWMVGFPLIFCIFLSRGDSRIRLLLIDINKFNNGNELNDQINYILKLILIQSNRGKEKEILLLDGFIETHKIICNRDDCPFKQRIIRNTRVLKAIQDFNPEAKNERYCMTLELIYQMYYFGVKKFPSHTGLRLSFAYFLLNNLRFKQQALQELNQAELNRPPFDVEFIIYRYKKLIEEEGNTVTNNEVSLNLLSELALEEIYRSMYINIDKCSMMHIEFWSQLTEEIIDLGKLNEIGSKINKISNIIEEQWRKINKISNAVPKAMKLFGKYLAEVKNDKAVGEDLLDRALQISIKKKTNKAKVKENESADLMFDDVPSIVVSGDPDRMGTITGINTACSVLFGYNKNELINRKINSLMPPLYAKYHDSFLDNYLMNQGGKFFDRERMLFGKSKSNYIFPVYLNITVSQNMMHEVQFLGNFRVDKVFKHQAFIITNEDGIVESLSAGCLTLLRIDNKTIGQKKNNINDYFPNVVDDKDKYLQKGGGPIKYSFSADSIKKADKIDTIIGYMDISTEVNLNLNITEINFTLLPSVGFVFRFELIPNKVLPKPHNTKNLEFKFIMDMQRMMICGEFYEQTNSDVNTQKLDASELGPQSSRSYQEKVLPDETFVSSASKLQKNPKPGNMYTNFVSVNSSPMNNVDPNILDELLPSNGRINYAEGIKLKRLFHNQVKDVEEEEEEQAMEEEEEEDEQDEQRRKMGYGDSGDALESIGESGSNLNYILRSKKAFNRLIENQPNPMAIKYLQYNAVFLLVLLLAISYADYLLPMLEFGKINDSIHIMNESNKRIAELENIVSNIRDLNLLNLGVFGTQGLSEREKFLKDSIGLSVSNITEIQTFLEKNTDYMSPEHFQFLINNDVKMYFSSDGTSALFDLNKATEQVITRAFNLKNLPLNEITDSSKDYYFLDYNMFNEYFEKLKKSSANYLETVASFTSGKNNTFVIFLIISGVALVFSICLLLPAMAAVNYIKAEILGLFVFIPDETVRLLHSKSQNFLTGLQLGEKEDNITEMEDEDLLRQNEAELQEEGNFGRKKRKKFKNSSKSQKKLYFAVIFTAGIIESFFIFNYFTTKTALENSGTLLKELNSTSSAEFFYNFVSNSERRLFLSPDSKILGAVSVEAVAEFSKQLLNIDSIINQEHSINTNIHNSIYRDSFVKIMSFSPCDILIAEKYITNKEVCLSFADGNVQQGMTVAFTRHFENIRFLFTLYGKYLDNNTFEINYQNETINFVNVSQDKLRNKILNLFNLKQAEEILIMQREYIKGSLRFLIKEFERSIDEAFTEKLNQRLALLLVFNFIILLFYFFLWIPMVRRLSKDIWQTRMMITMIPLEVVGKTKSIRTYIKSIFKNKIVDENKK